MKVVWFTSSSVVQNTRFGDKNETQTVYKIMYNWISYIISKEQMKKKSLSVTWDIFNFQFSWEEKTTKDKKGLKNTTKII